MIKSGFALESISTGDELAWWRNIPPRVRVPGEKITVDGASVGWEFGDYRIVAKDKELPDPVPVVPESISDRQFAHALWKAGTITFEEAMAFVQTGTIPEALQSAIDAIKDEDERKSASLLIAGATIFNRSHPITRALGAVMNKTDEEIDALWTEAAAL